MGAEGVAAEGVGVERVGEEGVGFGLGVEGVGVEGGVQGGVDDDDDATPFPLDNMIISQIDLNTPLPLLEDGRDGGGFSEKGVAVLEQSQPQSQSQSLPQSQSQPLSPSQPSSSSSSYTRGALTRRSIRPLPSSSPTKPNHNRRGSKSSQIYLIAASEAAAATNMSAYSLFSSRGHTTSAIMDYLQLIISGMPVRGDGRGVSTHLTPCLFVCLFVCLFCLSICLFVCCVHQYMYPIHLPPSLSQPIRTLPLILQS